MRGRSYSYSPSPPRGYSRRGRSPSPRGRHGGRGRDLPTSLLVRNLRHDCRPDDLRRAFSQFGPIKDIYLPRDYYTGDPRGFGFVQFVDSADANEAKYQMDGQILLGRELTVVFAQENRKKPSDMRERERSSRRRPQRSISPSPRGGRSHSRSRSRSYSASPRRQRLRSRSLSPVKKRSYSRSPSVHSRSRSRSVSRSRSPPPTRERNDDRNSARSPVRERSLSASE
ncbi:serine/arginine-rich SC35-like splicing factor SCL33 [Wolffia australiana]